MGRTTWALAIAVIVASLGCHQGSKGTGEHFASFTDLNPVAPIDSKAKLELGKIEIPVEVVQKKTEDSLTFDLRSYDQSFEQEVYKFDGASFNLAYAAGDNYEPALPLLKFPMNVGDEWQWSGTMTSGNLPHKATAVVKTSTEQVLLPGAGATNCVLVGVDLAIDSGGPNPATRKLRFWFVKNGGLVKRQFGIGSSRDPGD